MKTIYQVLLTLFVASSAARAAIQGPSFEEYANSCGKFTGPGYAQFDNASQFPPFSFFPKDPDCVAVHITNIFAITTSSCASRATNKFHLMDVESKVRSKVLRKCQPKSKTSGKLRPYAILMTMGVKDFACFPDKPMEVASDSFAWLVNKHYGLAYSREVCRSPEASMCFKSPSPRYCKHCTKGHAAFTTLGSPKKLTIIGITDRLYVDDTHKQIPFVDLFPFREEIEFVMFECINHGHYHPEFD